MVSSLLRFFPSRRLRLLFLLALGAAFAMVAACGDESEPTATDPLPTATATVAPTSPPTASPAPAATSTTEAAPPAVSMRDFVMDASLTGKDLIDRLSEEEVACIKQAYGDTIFQFILGSPMVAQGGDPAMAAPMFSCMTEESFAHLTAAFLAMLTGAESGESRNCFADLAREHPGAARASAGIELEGYETGHISRHEFRLLYFDCLNDGETVRYFSRLWDGVRSANTLTGYDILDVFTDPEVACFRDYFGDSYDKAFLSAPMSSGALGAHELHEACFTKDTSGRLFVTVMSTLLGGFTDETTACLVDFGSEHEHYVDDLVFTTPERLGAMPDEKVAELARDGSIWAECMTDEAYSRLWDLLLDAGAIGS
ncbi:MAG: hypothetical protein OXC98_13995 [bacterium]|nr:hypothetical protein [Acidimicrobiia bacterium]MCY4651447.1 hypothetical protein [bacterium]